MGSRPVAHLYYGFLIYNSEYEYDDVKPTVFPPGDDTSLVEFYEKIVKSMGFEDILGIKWNPIEDTSEYFVYVKGAYFDAGWEHCKLGLSDFTDTVPDQGVIALLEFAQKIGFEPPNGCGWFLATGYG
jgi:hypothetical protein